jgi:hypothetical protein
MYSRATTNCDWHDCYDYEYDDDFGPERFASVDDGFERGAALNGLWVHVQSQQLRSGRVTGVFSGVTVDLRQAALSPEGATIHVQSAVSGIHFLVPPDWDVVCEVDAIWSSISEHRRAPRSDAPRPSLRIVGMVVAGGLSVR